MLRFRVNGTPAGQGSKARGRNGGVYEQSAATLKPWREAIRSETQAQAGGRTCYPDGPVAVRVHFYLARPAGHFGTGRNAGRIKPSAPPYPVAKQKNDLDKFCRALLDGLTDGGAFGDDSQVVQLDAAKFWAAGGCPPGAQIEVEAR